MAETGILTQEDKVELIEVYHTPVEKQYRFRELIKAEDELQFLALNLNIPARSILELV